MRWCVRPSPRTPGSRTAGPPGAFSLSESICSRAKSAEAAEEPGFAVGMNAGDEMMRCDQTADVTYPFKAT